MYGIWNGGRLKRFDSFAEADKYARQRAKKNKYGADLYVIVKDARTNTESLQLFAHYVKGEV